MSAVLLLAQREIAEHRKLFPIALIAGFAPFALVPVLGLRLGTTLFVGSALAWLVTLAIALLLGFTLIGGELAAGRHGFFFARPLEWWQIFGGKLLGGALLAFGAGLLAALPVLVTYWRPSSEMGTAILALFVGKSGAVLLASLVIITSAVPYAADLAAGRHGALLGRSLAWWQSCSRFLGGALLLGSAILIARSANREYWPEERKWNFLARLFVGESGALLLASLVLVAFAAACAAGLTAGLHGAFLGRPVTWWRAWSRRFSDALLLVAGVLVVLSVNIVYGLPGSWGFFALFVGESGARLLASLVLAALVAPYAAELATGRNGFFLGRSLGWWRAFSRPFSTVLLLSSGALALLSLVVGQHTSALASLVAGQHTSDPLRTASTAVLLTCLVLIALAGGHAAGIVWRSRDAWIGLDLGLIAAACLDLPYLRVKLLQADLVSLPFQGWAAVTVGGVVVALLLVADAAQVALGRTDLRRGHRILSLVFWSLAWSVLAGVNMLAWWAVHPAVTDLVRVETVSVAPAGDWVAVAGPVRWRGSIYRPTFIVNTAADRWLKIDPQSAGVAFSADGRRVAWLEEGSAEPGSGCNVRVANLTQADIPVEAVPLSPAPLSCSVGAASLSPDSQRMLLFQGEGVTVYAIDSGRRLFWLPPVAGRPIVLGRFMRSDLVRVYRARSGPGADESQSIEILEVSDGSVKATGVIDATGVQELRLDASGERLIALRLKPRPSTRPSARLYEGRTGTWIADLAVDDPRPVDEFETMFKTIEAVDAGFYDGNRVAVAVAEHSGDISLRLFDPDGHEQGVVFLGWGGEVHWAGGSSGGGGSGRTDDGVHLVYHAAEPRHSLIVGGGVFGGWGGRVRFAGEPAPGLIAVGRGGSGPGELAIVDAHAARLVRTTEGLEPLGGVPLPGSAPGSRLFLNEDRRLVRLDPRTGARRDLLYKPPPAFLPRSGHAMTFDDARGLVLLFGGVSYSRDELSRDKPGVWFPSGVSMAPSPWRSPLWSWDGRTWRRLDAEGPESREDALFAFDRRRGRAVLYAGWGRNGAGQPHFLNDTWEWDGASWRFADDSGPGPHGEWDGASWPLGDGTGLFSYSAVMAYDDARGAVVLYAGGWKEPHTVVLSRGVWQTPREGGTHWDWTGRAWEWDGSHWQPIFEAEPRRGSVPIALVDRRLGHGPILVSAAMSYGARPGSFFPAGETTLGELYSWDRGPSSRIWFGDEPALMAGDDRGPRDREDFAVAPWAGGLLLYRGSETWSWNGTQWRKEAGSSPPRRRGTAVAYDARRDRVVLFGGEDDGGPLGDTWEWDGKRWTLSAEIPERP